VQPQQEQLQQERLQQQVPQLELQQLELQQQVPQQQALLQLVFHHKQSKPEPTMQPTMQNVSSLFP